MYFELMNLIIYLFIALLISMILGVLSIFLSTREKDFEKLTAYECGFDPFEDSRGRFDIRFYLVSLIFILFDLEISFLYPWAHVLFDIGLVGIWSMIVFLVILVLGFVYEWRVKALDW